MDGDKIRRKRCVSLKVRERAASNCKQYASAPSTPIDRSLSKCGLNSFWTHLIYQIDGWRAASRDRLFRDNN